MFFDINKNLCDMYTGLNPLELLNYPAEDVFSLINETIDYNGRNNNGNGATNYKSGVIRKQAGDNWF